jgi:hypothetical protein
VDVLGIAVGALAGFLIRAAYDEWKFAASGTGRSWARWFVSVEVAVDADGRPGRPVRDAVLRSWQVRA